MLAGTILYLGMMSLSAVLRAGGHPWVMMFLIAGVITAMAIATVSVIEGGGTWRRIRPIHSQAVS